MKVTSIQSMLKYRFVLNSYIEPNCSMGRGEVQVHLQHRYPVSPVSPISPTFPGSTSDDPKVILPMIVEHMRKDDMLIAELDEAIR